MRELFFPRYSVCTTKLSANRSGSSNPDVAAVPTGLLKGQTEWPNGRPASLLASVEAGVELLEDVLAQLASAGGLQDPGPIAEDRYQPIIDRALRPGS